MKFLYKGEVSMEQLMELTPERLEAFESAFEADRANRIAMIAATENGLHAASRSREAVQRDLHTFSVSLKQGKITNQKQSGRCWMFAALNTMRFKIMRDLELENFELSQAYLFFYDKLEKANYFLENILETLDEPTNGRLVSYLLTDPMGDGGQWDMLTGLIKKYGVVPKEAYPESKASSSSREMDACLTGKLREYACELRKLHNAGNSPKELRHLKQTQMSEIYRILCICLGKPPKTFDFEYREKDKFYRDLNLTPQAFYEKYIGLELDDYVSLINAPTSDKPYDRSYTVKFLGSVREGRPVRYLNLPIEELKRAAIAQLKDGSPVWFGCDVGKCSDRDSGILDPEIHDLESLLNTRFEMSKADRLDYGQSLMTHAMVFQGVNLDEDGKPNRWRVENSWGEDAGSKGYYVMTDRWFDEYMYQVVVNKKYLTEKQLAAYNAEPTELEPWDPMGSLALVH